MEDVLVARAQAHQRMMEGHKSSQIAKNRKETSHTYQVRQTEKARQSVDREIKLKATLAQYDSQREQKLQARLKAETPTPQPKTEETPDWIHRMAVKSSKALEKLRQKPPQRPPTPVMQPAEGTA
jgi:hypothetical protein